MTSTWNRWQHHLAWGLGLGAAVVGTIQILTWLGLGMSHLTWVLTWALVVVFSVLAGKSLGRHLGEGERPSLVQALVLLVVMILVGRVIYQTYMFVYINFIDPTWVDTVAEVWRGQLEEAGSSAEQIDQSIASFRKQWETPFVFTLGIVAYTLPQLVLGLVAMIAGVVQPWKKR